MSPGNGCRIDGSLIFRAEKVRAACLEVGEGERIVAAGVRMHGSWVERGNSLEGIKGYRDFGRVKRCAVRAIDQVPRDDGRSTVLRICLSRRGPGQSGDGQQRQYNTRSNSCHHWPSAAFGREAWSPRAARISSSTASWMDDSVCWTCWRAYGRLAAAPGTRLR